VKINGVKLKEAREQAGVTRSELAVVADLSHVRIWQMETEDESNVNENIVKAIANRLNVVAESLQ
jgi:transcriptional regulator with XRE-family HTH domain